MPWTEASVMDSKIRFINDVIAGIDNHSALCRRHGISRKTGYKWKSRYVQEGIDGLRDVSRRPHGHPYQTPYAVREAILELRQTGIIKLGARKIRRRLQDRFRPDEIPSETTINKILKEAGLVQSRRRRRRVSPGDCGYGPGDQANDLWSADYKGQFLLRDQTWCYPLTIMDSTSRYLLSCTGVEGTDLANAQRVFRRTFREYGMPRRIRTDNGVPFASTATAGLSRLSIWWIRLGILPERIEPGKPQQNGSHERMHQTLKSAATRPPSRTLRAQQRRFNQFQREYNNERPHESLGQETPDSQYEVSPRPYPEKLPEIVYPSYYAVCRVNKSGLLYWQGLRIYVGNVLEGQEVGFCQVADGIWQGYFGPIQLGQVNLRDVRRGSSPYINIEKV